MLYPLIVQQDFSIGKRASLIKTDKQVGKSVTKLFTKGSLQKKTKMKLWTCGKKGGGVSSPGKLFNEEKFGHYRIILYELGHN